MTAVEIGAIVGAAVGLYIAFHAGAGATHYRHRRNGCAGMGHRRAGMWASLGRGPYVRLSAPVGGGFRISRRL